MFKNKIEIIIPYIHLILWNSKSKSTFEILFDPNENNVKLYYFYFTAIMFLTIGKLLCVTHFLNDDI